MELFDYYQDLFYVTGNYALGIAAARGNTAVVQYLLQEININKTIRNNEGKTPLDIAQETDHQEVVRYLTCKKNFSIFF